MSAPEPLLRSLPADTAGRDRVEISVAPGQTASITVCPDGPLLVRGDVVLTTADGTVIPRHRSTLALCRCGGSGRPPLCDGTHKVTGFRAG